VKPVLSILIPTLKDRASHLKKLKTGLMSQATKAGVYIEILTECDQGELTVGRKRNMLLDRAAGEFCAFVDDDDLVSTTYVKDVSTAIGQARELDCVGFFGEVYFLDRFGGTMIHSIACSNWTEDGKFYYRPPNHLNPIRSKLAKRVRFKNIRFSEDHFWSVELRNCGLLQREIFLGEKPLYTYRCNVAKKQL